MKWPKPEQQLQLRCVQVGQTELPQRGVNDAGTPRETHRYQVANRVAMSNSGDCIGVNKPRLN